eukprot:jgi/Chlat1/676/Chrsp104S01278
MAEVWDGADSAVVTVAPLSLDAAVARVQDPTAGAVATFTGRDTFEGKRVLRLEYEAYAPMAARKMIEICQQMRSKWSGLVKIAMSHRTGPVAIGESSVLIAVSSAHRADALEAARFAIDELKATVPVWKKEFYEDGSVWKENAEDRRRPQAAVHKHRAEEH